MNGLKQYRAYRVMLSVFRSLWFLNDIVIVACDELKIKPSDIKFEDFAKWFFALEESKRKYYFKMALLFGVSLDNDEIVALCSMKSDKNNVAYSRENINNMALSELIAIMVDVCYDLSGEEVFF